MTVIFRTLRASQYLYYQQRHASSLSNRLNNPYVYKGTTGALSATLSSVVTVTVLNLIYTPMSLLSILGSIGGSAASGLLVAFEGNTNANANSKYEEEASGTAMGSLCGVILPCIAGYFQLMENEPQLKLKK